MAVRIKKETLYLRHDFTQEERLEMGSNLAGAHNRLSEIEDEEAVMKAQIKDRKATVEQSVGTLSRNLSSGFEMRNVECELLYDAPNIGEVTYKRKDNGAVVKTRAMTELERQMDLPLETPAQVAESVEKSASAAKEFFGPGQPAEQPAAESTAPVPEALAEDASFDEAYKSAVASAARHKTIVASLLQRELCLSYGTAVRIMDRMKAEGLIAEDGVVKKGGTKKLGAE